MDPGLQVLPACHPPAVPPYSMGLLAGISCRLLQSPALESQFLYNSVILATPVSWSRLPLLVGCSSLALPAPFSPHMTQINLALFTLDSLRCMCLCPFLFSPSYLQYTFSSILPRNSHVFLISFVHSTSFFCLRSRKRGRSWPFLLPIYGSILLCLPSREYD